MKHKLKHAEEKLCTEEIWTPWRGFQEKAAIQNKALRRGKNLALQKERVRSKMTLRKVGAGLKRMGS